MCNAFIHIDRVTIFVYPLKKKKISQKISPHPSFYKCIVLHLTTVTGFASRTTFHVTVVGRKKPQTKNQCILRNLHVKRSLIVA